MAVVIGKWVVGCNELALAYIKNIDLYCSGDRLGGLASLLARKHALTCPLSCCRQAFA